MLTIAAKGSVADVIQHARDVHGRLVPYAAAAALTRTASIAAKRDLPDAMRQAFDRPTAYTLNSLFVVPASKANLVARVHVKNAAAGVVPERFLQPEVEGGSRGEKRFERALRYAGILLAGERAMPGDGVRRDANGNVSGALIRSVLAALKVRDSKGRSRTANLFVGTAAKKGGTPTRGIWQRDGRHRLQPIFIFTRTPPHYRQRLDFEGTVERTAARNFQPEFSKALGALLSR